MIFGGDGDRFFILADSEDLESGEKARSVEEPPHQFGWQGGYGVLPNGNSAYVIQSGRKRASASTPTSPTSPPPKFGMRFACALATALDDARSGTRPRSHFPQVPVPTRSKAPASRKHSKIAAPSAKFGVLALARLRPLWMTHAREHVLALTSHEFPFRRDPKLRQAGSTPK